jgi:small subunit ribosomal protein S15
MMAIEKGQKQTIIDDYRLHDSDTGSPEVQIALLSTRINYLTEHFKIHKKEEIA